MISYQHQLVFVHVPKCAGMAVEEALGGLPLPQRSEQHFTGHQYARYHPQEWARFHRFAVVRDPIRRCLSYVRFLRRWDATWRKHLRDVPEETLLRDALMSTNLLTTHAPARMLTGEEEVLKVEELATAWPAFAARHDLPDELPRHNASPGSTSRDQLSPGTQLMIWARFPDDFARHGYARPDVDFHALPPSEQGAVMWARLRGWAVRFAEQGGPEASAEARRSLDAWLADLPDPAWRRRFEDVVAQHPPPLAPLGNLAYWTEVVHDRVRAQLGQPLWEPWHPADH
ncbi:MAG: sulfotransferase family 2 domain-containing protein [Alphaproteobacteria bacterium]|nr:sulfotransferase family 2 domain-containing protein [Alphaproteobacteria bacterium]